ncbi:hypothetical protein [Massilia sp. PWRC2]|uniref:hypothetical protein n=1 Tax=Massilia sp. PWRC2 TaxID=2804626 RepID=UPI003CE6E27C
MSISITTGSAATAYAAGASTPSPASLQAQLQRYEHQLSDCVNCASAKTPQGKADIDTISARISQVQQRLAQLDGNSEAPAAPTTGASGAGARHGGFIDVFA